MSEKSSARQSSYYQIQLDQTDCLKAAGLLAPGERRE